MSAWILVLTLTGWVILDKSLAFPIPVSWPINGMDKASTQAMRTELIIKHLEQSLALRSTVWLTAEAHLLHLLRGCDLGPEAPYPNWHLGRNLPLFTGQEGGRSCVAPAVGLG